MDLNSMFPNGKTFKSEALARRALNKFENSLHPSSEANYHSVIIPVGNDKYQVIIILRHENKAPVLWFVDAGFCVTN